MSFLSTFLPALRPLTPHYLRRIERDVDDEIRFHIDSRIEENRAQGMAPPAARSEARRRFGDAKAIAARCVRVQTDRPLRIGLRALETVLTLALGLGLVASILLLVNGVLFRAPASFRDEARRVAVWWDETNTGNSLSGSTIEEFRTVRAMDDVFEHLTLAQYLKVNVNGEGEPENVRAKYVSAQYFRLFGAEPLLGRVFAPDEEESAVLPVTILSYGLWQRQFGGDTRVLGRTLEVNDRPHTVVGVMPADLTMYMDTGLYIPMAMPPVETGRRTLLMAGRLRPGVSYEQAQSRVVAAVRSLMARDPQAYVGLRVKLRRLEDVYSEHVQPRLFSKLTVVGLLLIVVFLHVLHRRVSAQRPPSYRWLGSSVVENVLMATVAAAIGLVLAQKAVPVLARPVIGQLAPLFDVRQDIRVVGITVGLALLAGLALGLLAWGVSAVAQNRVRVRCAFVTVELSLALVLLLCVAGPARTWMQSRVTPPGFEAGGVDTIDVSASSYNGTSRTTLFDDLLERARAVPGVRAASLTHAFPMRDRYAVLSFRDTERPQTLHRANFAVVDPGYTKLMGIPLVHGRRLTRADSGAIVINQALAHRLRSGSDPVGTRLRADPGHRQFEIVGVVGNVRQDALHAPVEPIIYRPSGECSGWGTFTLVLRTDDTSGDIAALVARSVRKAHPRLPVGMPVPAGDVIRASLRELRFETAWLGILAMLALTFALVDLAGLVLEELEPAGVRFSFRSRMTAMLRPVLGVFAAGLVVAAAVTWRLGQLDWPTFSALGSIDLATAGAILLALLIALGAMVGVVSLYLRSLDPLSPVRGG